MAGVRVPGFGSMSGAVNTNAGQSGALAVYGRTAQAPKPAPTPQPVVSAPAPVQALQQQQSAPAAVAQEAPAFNFTATNTTNAPVTQNTTQNTYTNDYSTTMQAADAPTQGWKNAGPAGEIGQGIGGGAGLGAFGALARMAMARRY